MEKDITPSDVARFLARKRWDKASEKDRKAVGKALAEARAKKRKPKERIAGKRFRHIISDDISKP